MWWFHLLSTLGSGWTQPPGMFSGGSQSSRTCSAVAWADVGGKQTTSTEGHPALLPDAPLKKQAR